MKVPILPRQRWLISYERSLFAVTPTRRTEFISENPVVWFEKQRAACREINITLLFAMEVPFES